MLIFGLFKLIKNDKYVINVIVCVGKFADKNHACI